jgi:cation transport ATPase
MYDYCLHICILKKFEYFEKQKNATNFIKQYIKQAYVHINIVQAWLTFVLPYIVQGLKMCAAVVACPVPTSLSSTVALTVG